MPPPRVDLPRAAHPPPAGRPPRRLRLPADRGAALLRQFQALEFTKHAARVRALWASELYRGGAGGGGDA